MLCPNCNFENLQDALVCENCGCEIEPNPRLRDNPFLKPLPNGMTVQEYDRRTYGHLRKTALSMTFHIVFCIFLSIIALFWLWMGIDILANPNEYKSILFLGFIFLFFATYDGLTLVFLLLKKKIGYILNKIRNIYSIVASIGIATATTIYLIYSYLYGSASDILEIESAFPLPLMMIVIACLMGYMIAFILILIIRLVMKYYKKRKHLFR